MRELTYSEILPGLYSVSVVEDGELIEHYTTTEKPPDPEDEDEDEVSDDDTP